MIQSIENSSQTQNTFNYDIFRIHQYKMANDLALLKRYNADKKHFFTRSNEDVHQSILQDIESVKHTLQTTFQNYEILFDNQKQKNEFQKEIRELEKTYCETMFKFSEDIKNLQGETRFNCFLMYSKFFQKSTYQINTIASIFYRRIVAKDAYAKKEEHNFNFFQQVWNSLKFA